ncbi:MAG TPA: NAD(P)H-quinone oxidoreductase [Gemmatimonadaceae bacterium]|nr:NAD(P)H-quinone oxidoreductase [Gemmatimonadaceae bacterium]
MRAIVIARPGGPEVLEPREVPRPVPGAGEVLVRVHATALNRADVLQREGRYPAPAGSPTHIPGLEFAGEVAELGPGARDWDPGDRVFGITGGGAYAEYLVAHERAIAAIPDTLDWAAAAAVPEAFITAHDALTTQSGTRLSERVLVHAVGSGVGLAAVQLARAIGAVPYGTARKAAKVEAARALGLEDGLVVSEDLAPMVERARAWTAGVGMDVVLDLVGGAYVPASLEALATHGRLILIGTLAGRAAEIPLGRVLASRLTLRGTVLRARPLEEKIAATRAFARDVVPLLASGAARPVLDRVYPLAEAAEAHRRMESNDTIGKIVLTMDHAD